MIRSKEHIHCRVRAGLVAMLAVGLVCTAAWSISVSAAGVGQKHFASAEEAVQALIAALKAGDTKAMLDVLGSEARPLIVSGDAVEDRHDRQRVVQEYEESHSLAMSGETKAVLQVGNGASGATSSRPSRYAAPTSMPNASTTCALHKARRFYTMRRSS
jgi:hypothetical protein